MAKQVTAYKIHNMSRAIETRQLRAASTAHRAPKKLMLGGVVRVLRGRPATVTEVVLRRMLAELQKREARGELKVTNMAGQRVDLTTLKPLEPPPVDPPKPVPPLDSAADDNKYPIGEGQPQHPGGAAQTEKLETPSVVNYDVPEGKEESVEGMEKSPEDLEDMEVVYQTVYDAWSKKELESFMKEYEVTDSSGNKMDLAKRLVNAGLRVAENG